MSEPKTKLTTQDPKDFLVSIESEEKRIDGLKLLAVFESATGEKAKMWGTAIVGFGSYVIKKGTAESVWPLVGFSPRKQNLTLYIKNQAPEEEELLSKLGKHTTGKVCVYINSLADVDEKILSEMIKISFQHAKKSYA